jgi:hypothetical protein
MLQFGHSSNDLLEILHTVALSDLEMLDPHEVQLYILQLGESCRIGGLAKRGLTKAGMSQFHK